MLLCYLLTMVNIFSNGSLSAFRFLGRVPFRYLIIGLHLFSIPFFSKFASLSLISLYWELSTLAASPFNLFSIKAILYIWFLFCLGHLLTLFGNFILWFGKKLGFHTKASFALGFIGNRNHRTSYFHFHLDFADQGCPITSYFGFWANI